MLGFSLVMNGNVVLIGGEHVVRHRLSKSTPCSLFNLRLIFETPAYLISCPL